jgi:hypothetical protein
MLVTFVPLQAGETSDHPLSLTPPTTTQPNTHLCRNGATQAEAIFPETGSWIEEASHGDREAHPRRLFL